jgi:hypothetical protein
MTDETLQSVQDLLSGLSQDIRKLAGSIEEEKLEVRRHLDELAAHILAIEGVLIALLRDNPTAAEKAKDWIDGQITEHAGSAADAELATGIAENLIKQSFQ